MSVANLFKGKTILITGGTGTVGLGIAQALEAYKPKNIRLMTNDENSMDEAVQILGDKSNFDFFLGEMRDSKQLKHALEGVDIVFHTTALKHVYICEDNPFEAVYTNINGIVNLVDAVFESNVQKVIFTSTDKAVNPTNMMGASKLVGEKLITNANCKGKNKTIFSSVRFGNVLSSRGSVIPLFKKQIKNGEPVTITDHRMSRFIISLDEAVNLLFKATEVAIGGEIFVLKMESIRVIDIAEALGGKGTKTKIVGPRPGEKIYEDLMTEEELMRTYDLGDMFVILPDNKAARKFNYSKYHKFPSIKNIYSSRAQKPLSTKQLRLLLEKEAML